METRPNLTLGLSILYNLIFTLLVCLNLYVTGRNLPVPDTG